MFTLVAPTSPSRNYKNVPEHLAMKVYPCGKVSINKNYINVLKKIKED